MEPAKHARPVSTAGAKKKSLEAKQAWGPAHKKLLFPLVGGIALLAILTLILVIHRKK